MKDLSFLNGIRIAHRGLYNNENKIPENSMLAFSKALELKIPIELDIHLTKDKRVVVFHDDNLLRMTGLNSNIKDLDYSKIKNLYLKNSKEKIPLLQDALKLVNGKVLIDIEFKIDNRVGVLEKEATKILDNYKGKFLVKSFSPLSVLWFKINRPQYIRGQLSYGFEDYRMSFIKKYLLKNMFFNFITKPDFVAYGIDSINQKIRDKLKGKIILSWTINTVNKLNKSKKYSDGIIFENKENLLKYII